MLFKTDKILDKLVTKLVKVQEVIHNLQKSLEQKTLADGPIYIFNQNMHICLRKNKSKQSYFWIDLIFEAENFFFGSEIAGLLESFLK